jgi:hypothetical protein
LGDTALGDLGVFVHRTVVGDEQTYTVRIDDGALLDGAEQIEHARGHLTPEGQRQIAAILGCKLERLDAELDTLAARANTTALKIRITGELRDRARNGRARSCRARAALRRGDLGRRPRLHARPRLRAAQRQRHDNGAREGVLRRHPPRRRRAP